jgi:hypothetical protein
MMISLDMTSTAHLHTRVSGDAAGWHGASHQGVPDGVEQTLVIARSTDGDAKVVGDQAGEGVAAAHGDARRGQPLQQRPPVGTRRSRRFAADADALWRPLSSGR